MSRFVVLPRIEHAFLDKAAGTIRALFGTRETVMCPHGDNYLFLRKLIHDTHGVLKNPEQAVQVPPPGIVIKGKGYTIYPLNLPDQKIENLRNAKLLAASILCVDHQHPGPPLTIPHALHQIDALRGNEAAITYLAKNLLSQPACAQADQPKPPTTRKGYCSLKDLQSYLGVPAFFP